MAEFKITLHDDLESPWSPYVDKDDVQKTERVVSAFIATAFAQDDAGAAGTQWRRVAAQLRPKVPKLAALMDEAEPDVLAYMAFPKEHWTKLHSANPLERLNGEIKRRTSVVGIFPNEDAITRLAGAILLEQNDEWAVQRARYMTLATLAPLSDNPIVSLSACQLCQSDQPGNRRRQWWAQKSYTTLWDTIQMATLRAISRTVYTGLRTRVNGGLWVA